MSIENMKKYGMTNGQGYILRIGLKIKLIIIKKADLYKIGFFYFNK